MNSFYAFPTFREKYGQQLPGGSYQIPVRWQVAISNGARIGSIIGLIINGVVLERFGYRKTMLSSLFAISCFVFIPFFAQNVGHLLAGQLLLGLPWGVFQTVTVVYASEVCPVPLRGILTNYVNLCWVMGQLIASGVLRSFVSRTDQWSYRIPFGLQWMWPVPIAIGCWFAPESPWWLVRKGRMRDAEKSLLRLTTGDMRSKVDTVVSMMIVTTEHSRELSAGASWVDCFKGTNLRRTEITCLTWAAQALCGAAFMSYSTYFFQQAGLKSVHSFNMTIGQYGLGFVGTVLSWWLMKYFGRRTLYVWGLFILDVLLLIIGFTGIAPKREATYWATGAMLLLFTFFYDCTIGPVCYALVSEIPNIRVRAKTVAGARMCFNVAQIVNSVITPYML
jgi:SP family general alpha glucoside:H+ symporter-like MFS transporter